MDDQRVTILRDWPIKKAVNKMAWPAIVGFMVLAIYNLADTVFVSWLGYQATSATQVVFPLMMVTSAIGLAFGIGAASYVSRLMGSGQLAEAKKVAATAFFTAIIVGILFYLAFRLLMEPILVAFGASPEVLPLAKDYATYIALGSLFVIPSMVMNNLLRSEGSSSLSMIGMSAGAALNMLIDPLFIFVFDWGIIGAAIATMLSQAVSFAILYSHYLRGRALLTICLKDVKVNVRLYLQILKIGLPTFFRQLLASLALALLNRQAFRYGGDSLLAALGLAIKITYIPNYYIIGMGQGVQPVIGYNFGAANRQRVVKAMRYGVKASLTGAIIFSGIALIFAEKVMLLFRATPEVSDYGAMLLRMLAIATLFMAFSNTTGIFYQALGKGKETMFLSITRQGLFFIPLVYLLPVWLGQEGIMLTQLIVDILTFIVAAGLVIPYIRHGNLQNDIALHQGDVLMNEKDK